jgi:cyclopropane-fatty-acyl-phospholipid synthase
MTSMQESTLTVPIRQPASGWAGALERTLAAVADGLPAGAAFEVELPGSSPRQFGPGAPAFRLSVRSQRGLRALVSLDELAIGEAYLDGDLDLEGDLVAALCLRGRLRDRHWLFYLWSTYLRPLLFGQVRSDRRAIREHYDESAEFYHLFLDREARCYSHGYFGHDDEPLEAAIARKLDTVIETCGMRPGWRVLDIGAGWGAFTRHAGLARH